MLLGFKNENGIIQQTPSVKLVIGGRELNSKGMLVPVCYDHFKIDAGNGHNGKTIEEKFNSIYGEKPKEVLMMVSYRNSLNQIENIANRIEKVEYKEDASNKFSDIVASYPLDNGNFTLRERKSVSDKFGRETFKMRSYLDFDKPAFDKFIQNIKHFISEMNKNDFKSELDFLYAQLVLNEENNYKVYPYAKYLRAKYKEGKTAMILERSFSFNFYLIEFNKETKTLAPLTENIVSFSTGSDAGMNNVNSFIEKYQLTRNCMPFTFGVTKVVSQHTSNKYSLVYAAINAEIMDLFHSKVGAKKDILNDFALHQGQNSNLLGSGDNITKSEI